MLLCPVASGLPNGPRGVTGSPGNLSCEAPSTETRPASYLLPPFSLPSSLVQEIYKDWSELGHAISRSHEDQLGGAVRGFGDPDSNWCNIPQSRTFIHAGVTELFAPFRDNPSSGLFVFLLPDIDDLRLLLQLLCRLQQSGHSLRVLLYSESRTVLRMREIYNSSCSVQYDATRNTGRHIYPAIYDWLHRMECEADVIFTINEPATQPVRSERAVIIRIPRDNLPYVDWMGSLSLSEWMGTTRFLLQLSLP